MILRKVRLLEIERGSTRSPSVEKSLWKWLWTCRKTEYEINIKTNASPVSSAVLATRQRNGRPKNRGSISVREKEIFSSPKRPDWF